MAGAIQSHGESGKAEICYELTLTAVATATAAHIHEGAVGVAGDPVVHLEAPADGSSSVCVSVERENLQCEKGDGFIFRTRPTGK